MKTRYLLLSNNILQKTIGTKQLLFFIVGLAIHLSISGQPVNIDFEATTAGAYSSAGGVNGWTISSQSATSCNTSTLWTSGSPEFSIVSTPIVAGLPTVPLFAIPLASSPLGGTKVAKLNDWTPGGLRTKISQTFNVTSANSYISYCFAGVWEDGGHLCCEQAGLKISLYDCNGMLITCNSVSVNAAGSNCGYGGNSLSVTGNRTWSSWQTYQFDLTNYVGYCVTLEVINSDCIYGTHFGTVYFDSKFQVYVPPIGSPVCPFWYPDSYPNLTSFCQGSGQAQIYAPLGYMSYQWYAPGSPVVTVSPQFGGNTPAMTATNAVAGNVYTVQLVTPSGCTYTAIDTLQYTTVSILGLGSNSSCANGASGSASVSSNGSSTGYNYTWLNSTNSVVSTYSFANNLSPGIYSIQISATGASLCGTSAGTVAVGVSTLNTYTLIKPFCGGKAFLSGAPPGGASNYQWYFNNATIASTLGGTAPGYTVTSPVTSQSYIVAYTTNQGCRDSVLYILQQIASPSVAATNISWACLSANNASAAIVINQPFNVGIPQNSYSVFSVPAGYTTSLSPTSSNSFTASGLSAGIYSVIVNNGLCGATTSFTVNNMIFGFNLSPASPTVCPGNSLIAGISFTNAIVPGQYTFSWSPSSYIVGGSLNTGNISVMITPAAVAPGTATTTVYTVTVTPTIANCPLIKSMTVTAANPLPPVINPIPPFCTNVALKTITVSPAGGGTFSTSVGNWLGSATGNINPILCAIGTNTFAFTSTLSGCPATATGSFSVNWFNSAALTTTLLNVCGMNCSALMPFVQGAITGIWSGPGVSSTSFCPSSPVGSYVLTYSTISVPNPTMCPDSRNITINMASAVIPTIVPAGPFCNNSGTVQLLVFPNTGSFTPSPYLTAYGIFTPSLCPIGSNTLQYQLGANTCTAQSTAVVNIEAFVPSTLLGTIGNQCTSNPAVNLSSLPLSQSGNWFGIGVSGNIFNPGMAGPGTFTLYYTTISSPGNACFSQSTLAITVYSVPIISVSGNTIICRGDLTVLGVTGADNYSWSNGFSSNAIGVTPTVSTSYTVTGTNFISGCSNTKTLSVTVNTVPIVTISGNLNICRGKTTALTGGGANTYLWSNNSTNTVISVTPFSTTSYTLIGMSSGNCSDTVVVTVNVIDCTGLNENSLKAGIKIYPNPTDGNLYFELESEAKIILYNELGQTVLESNLKLGNQLIDLRSFETGIYLLRVVQGSKSSLSKVVKTN